ncbi:MAG: LysM domain-containing protein [Candidatus Paceibacterota bacterium]|jgi:LysM repeat protein
MRKSFLLLLVVVCLVSFVSFAQAVYADASDYQEEYVVEHGDTLTSIADEVHLTVQQLACMNGISPKAKIRVGQVLKYPKPYYKTRYRRSFRIR